MTLSPKMNLLRSKMFSHANGGKMCIIFRNFYNGIKYGVLSELHYSHFGFKLSNNRSNPTIIIRDQTKPRPFLTV